MRNEWYLFKDENVISIEKVKVFSSKKNAIDALEKHLKISNSKKRVTKLENGLYEYLENKDNQYYVINHEACKKLDYRWVITKAKSN